MSENQIERYIAENGLIESIEECLRSQNYSLGMLLFKVYQHKNMLRCESSPLFRHLLHCLKKENDESELKEEKEQNVTTNASSIITELETLLEPNTNDNRTVAQEKKTNTFNITTLTKNKVRCLLLCNWCESKKLCELWNKMSKGNYTWNNIEIVWEEPCDWYVVMNRPPSYINPPLDKTILFHMEPNMQNNKHIWGDWAMPDKNTLKFCGTHNEHYNNNEWHLSKSYSQLSQEIIVKNEKFDGIISTILSGKYVDPGHIFRIDFAKFLERKGVKMHVFGSNKFDWNEYKGSLPEHCKDDSLLPYKYTFNAENFEIPNYYTEKIIDAILSECLIFYWGCPNLGQFIDKRAFVQLDFTDFDKNLVVIKRAIEENWWEKRLPYIKEAKQKILNEQGFFPRLERILEGC